MACIQSIQHDAKSGIPTYLQKSGAFRSIGVSQLSIWSPKAGAEASSEASSEAAIENLSKTMVFADGGAIDNNALFPLLKRKVAKIISFVALEKQLTTIQAGELIDVWRIGCV